ncbi:MAG TPA: hypothetical protein VFJ72_08060 [Rubrobacteraceae bacterium]|nr:hypothetical protein [Rubrobacteraceae bacterium]
MFGRLRGIFGGRREDTAPASSGLSSLAPEETAKIGTEEDPLRGYEAAVERHEEAARAEQTGDPERAIALYEKSVAERFVGSHPYEALARLHERRRNHADALRVTESYIDLARSGKMPRGAQRSADRKLPEFEARAERYRRSTSME